MICSSITGDLEFHHHIKNKLARGNENIPIEITNHLITHCIDLFSGTKKPIMTFFASSNGGVAVTADHRKTVDDSNLHVSPFFGKDVMDICANVEQYCMMIPFLLEVHALSEWDTVSWIQNTIQKSIKYRH